MVSYRKTLIGGAVTATARVETGTIAIPGGKGGVLVAVEVIVMTSVFTTAQTTGGKVDLTNDALDWTPFEWYTNSIVVLTSTSTGGANQKPFRFNCHKLLPSNSNVTVSYAPSDAGSQKLGVTLFWETSLSFRGVQTYSKANTGTEITQITVDDAHNTIAIPAEKGGIAMAVGWVVHGSLETIVQSGGKLEFINATDDWSPLEFLTSGASCIGAGAVEVDVEMKPINLPLSGNLDITTNFTPEDNQSQRIGAFVVWEGR